MELIKNAIGANGFVSTDTAAGYINPTYWNRQVLNFVEQNMVVAQFAKVYDDILGQDGASFNVTIGATPTAAAAVAESDDVTVSTYSKTQVTFTPSEYAKAYQISDKEARRAFFDVAQDMAFHIGYALALARDDAAITLIAGNAGNAATANGVAASAITTSDTLEYEDVVSAATLIRSDNLKPVAIVLSPEGVAQLAKAQQFSYVDNAGSSETLRNGKIGRIYGLDVYETTQIAPSSNVSTGLVIGTDQMGVPCFGIGRKALPSIRSERHELGRYTDIVGVEEWDMQILRANGFCTLKYYE